jgi:tRNA-specific 2-thiouridylase
MTDNLDMQKVVVGLSGGVDSTAAALLLKREKFDVIGVFIDVLGNNETGKQNARELAEKLAIELIYVDVSKEFDDIVISNFCNEYMKGRTPNPCILCNPTVKFKSLLKIADEKEAYYIATGHYANTAYDDTENRYFVSKAKSLKKDQSYMLYRLNSGVLSRLKLPLGNFESKEDVRIFVGELGFKNAEQKDSQEICFIPESMHYIDFLISRGYKIKEGEFVNSVGEKLGVHKGVPNYTIGQRKHLGMAFGKPMFVVELDGRNNKVTLGEHDELLKNQVFSTNNYFSSNMGDCVNSEISGIIPENYIGKTIQAKVRYAAAPQEATLHKVDDDMIRTVFEKPQRAVAPGQSIVFYDGDKVIGGGIING